MSVLLSYNYAKINLTTGECIGVLTSSFEKTAPEYIAISEYNEDYMGKYYINGVWYEDAEGTIPYEG